MIALLMPEIFNFLNFEKKITKYRRLTNDISFFNKSKNKYCQSTRFVILAKQEIGSNQIFERDSSTGQQTKDWDWF